MGFFLDPNEVKTQAGSMITAYDNDNNTLQQMKTNISSFSAESSLSGQAWDGAKAQLSGHQTIIDAFISSNNGMIADSRTLSAAVGGEELDQDKLEQEIQELEADVSSLASKINGCRYSIGNLSPKLSTEARAKKVNHYNKLASNYGQQLNINNENIAELKKKLEKLLEIESSTSSLFTFSAEVNYAIGLGIGSLSAAWTGSGYDTNKISEMEKTLNNDIENAALKNLLDQGITKEQVDNMKVLGYPASQIKAQWDSLQNKPERDFYIHLMNGSAEDYIEAFKTDPNLLSETFSIILADYSEHLYLSCLNMVDEQDRVRTDFTRFESFLNAILGQTPTNVPASKYNQYAYTKPSSRPAYLEKLYSGMTVIAEGRTIDLAFMDSSTDAYHNLYDQHIKSLQLTNLYSSIYCLTEEPEGVFSNYKGLDKRGVSLSNMKLVNNFLEYDLSQTTQTQTLDPYTKELVTKKQIETINVNLEVIFEKSVQADINDNSVLNKLEKESIKLKDKLAQNLVTSSALSLMNVAVPHSGLAIKTAQLLAGVGSGSSGVSKAGLSSLLSNKGVKLAGDTLESTIVSFYNYMSGSAELAKEKDSELTKQLNEWSGGMGVYRIGEYGKRLPSYSGLYDPDTLTLFSQFSNEGIKNRLPGLKELDEEGIKSFTKDLPKDYREEAASLLNGDYVFPTNSEEFERFKEVGEKIQIKYAREYPKAYLETKNEMKNKDFSIRDILQDAIDSYDSGEEE